MTKAELGKRIFDASYLTGDFTLRSGVYSNEYFDKYRFESQPDILRAVAEHLAQLLPDGIDAVAGLPLGGIPLATALSLHSGIPCLFVRKEAKSHGTRNWIEGMPVEGKKLCIIEDVVTTGGQIIDSIQILRKEGALIDTTLCVIARTGKAFANLEHHQVELRSLFTMQELKAANKK
ncbi:MAG: orotate phosphoribosyltransferase [Saprospiraceae bacterium]|nr:orotate phosphoribosyltransferase [Saprospiraceae bacterium]